MKIIYGIRFLDVNRNGSQESDISKMNTIGIGCLSNIKDDIPNTLYMNYWLASKYNFKYKGDTIYCVYYMPKDSSYKNSESFYRESYNQYSGGGQSYGLRPVFLINDNVKVNDDGYLVLE